MTKTTQKPSRHTTRGQIVRRMVEAEGGRFHGPIIEHLSIEEDAFWRVIDNVIAAARMDKNL